MAAPFNTSEFQFFNYGNPLAARTNSMQQAADVLYLERLVRSFGFDAGEAGGGVDGRLDTSTVVLGGHSQGATTLPLTLAYAPDEVQGGFLSASGAWPLPLDRAPRRRAALVDGLLGAQPGELDIFHPIPQILQTFADSADPPKLRRPPSRPTSRSTPGSATAARRFEVSTHLATALGVPIANPLTRAPLYGPDQLVAAGYRSPYESRRDHRAGLAEPAGRPHRRGGARGQRPLRGADLPGDRPLVRGLHRRRRAHGVAPGATPPEDPGTSCPR